MKKLVKRLIVRLLISIVMAFWVMFAWNHLLTFLIDVPTLTYHQSIIIYFFAGIIFPTITFTAKQLYDIKGK